MERMQKTKGKIIKRKTQVQEINTNKSYSAAAGRSSDDGEELMTTTRTLKTSNLLLVSAELKRNP